MVGQPRVPPPSMDAVLAIYATRPQAEEAVKALQHASFDMRKLSILGRDYHTEQDVSATTTWASASASGGRWGAFWGGLAAVPVGSAFLFIPALGHGRARTAGELDPERGRGCCGWGGLSAFGAA